MGTKRSTSSDRTNVTITSDVCARSISTSTVRVTLPRAGCGSFSDTGASFPNESFVVLAGGDATAAVSCPAGFTPGGVFIDSEDNEVFGDNADSYTMGNVGASTIVMNNNVDIIVCESGPGLEGLEMPRAPYCVFAGPGGCPSDFSSGEITTYDESSGNTDAINGTVGAITQQAASTTFPVCCY